MFSHCYLFHVFCCLLYSNYPFYVFIVRFIFVSLFCAIVFFLPIISPHLSRRLFSILVQVYRPLTPGGNPTAVN
jgi:hypothetical protein